MKKRQYTVEELENDPSLKWCGYRPYEAVYSKVQDRELRFVRYEPDGKVRLAELNSMAELPETVSPLEVRRLTAR